MAINETRLGGFPEALRPSVARWFERLEEAHGNVDLAAGVTGLTGKAGWSFSHPPLIRTAWGDSLTR